MDKYDYIEGIIIFIKGITGINYQLQIKEILKVYYQYNEKTFEMPDYYGGDQKNDGWVVEDAIFYQIFAPTRLKESLRKEIQDKFKADLEGLLNIVCKEGKWKGKIEEFIFLVNTFDGNLPHDSENFFEGVVNTLKDKYNVEFEYRVENNDYIRDLLYKIDDIECLKRLSSTLHIRKLIDFNAITETIIINLIEEISGSLNIRFMKEYDFETYKRISSLNKISINNLEEKREEIENIISKLDVVEKAVNDINQDILCENKFERVKNFVISKYNQLSKKYQGVKLYESLVEETLTHTNCKSIMEIPMKFLIVYIFDKCDIFKKE
ncbi:hypothetical protein [Clostridioides difficile]|uniref:hypothetical protein n=1 Tax=Clostridioides difficile TaxID=1496 RepID=UPI002FD42FA8|nr:hypothetical protein [Clostridioides difficile]HDO9648480.1 hypothetical protein [Clostridioides difficile]